jgi:hypothetical protein
VRDYLYLGDVTVYKVEARQWRRLEALLANSAPGRAKFFEIGDPVGVGWRHEPGRLIFVTIDSWPPARPAGNLTRWLVSLPPTLFLLVFFLVPALLMVAASFQHPGEFGGLAPFFVDGSST